MAVGGVDIPGLQGGGEGVAVTKGADGQLINLGRAVPIPGVGGQRQMVVRDQLLYNVGAGTNDNAVSKSDASTSMMQP